MDVPAQRDDEETRRLALAPEGGPRYLQHGDGSWSFVGDDGWPVTAEDLQAEVLAALALVSLPVIDVEPISVQDTEIR